MPEGYAPQEYLPDALRDAVLYEPGPFGFEKDIAKRMQWWAELKNRLGGGGADAPAPEA